MQIRCPHCGSPVMVRGNRWECGWCGDFGDVSSLESSQRAKLAELVDDALDVLERGTLSVLEGMQAFFEDEEEGKLPACRLVVYTMSKALIPQKNQNSVNLQCLQEFYRRYTFCSASEVLGAAQSRKPAFEGEFMLSKESVGSFWERVLKKLPPYAPDEMWPEWLEQIADGLSQIEGFFTDEEGSGVCDRLREIVNAHWSHLA